MSFRISLLASLALFSAAPALAQANVVKTPLYSVSDGYKVDATR